VAVIFAENRILRTAKLIALRRKSKLD